MAELFDEVYKVKINAKSGGNWLEFLFEFLYNDKPLFNPEITRGTIFVADEYDSWPLLDKLKEIAECKEDDKMFYWTAWEEEVVIEVRSFMKNLDKGIDGGFEFTFLIDPMYFKDGEQRYMLPGPALRMHVGREDVQKLINELGNEIAEIKAK